MPVNARMCLLLFTSLYYYSVILKVFLILDSVQLSSVTLACVAGAGREGGIGEIRRALEHKGSALEGAVGLGPRPPNSRPRNNFSKWRPRGTTQQRCVAEVYVLFIKI